MTKVPSQELIRLSFPLRTLAWVTLPVFYCTYAHLLVLGSAWYTVHMSYRWQLLKKKIEAQRLRADGFSIKAIEKKLRVARSTASLWCKDVKLTTEQLKALYWSSRAGAWKGSIVAARNKKAEKVSRFKTVANGAKKRFGARSKRDFFIGGVSLYAGEGSKTGNVVQFTNTNPLLVKFMVKWLRQHCRVPEEKLRGWVYIHQGSDEKKAKEFWSNLTSPRGKPRCLAAGNQSAGKQ